MTTYKESDKKQQRAQDTGDGQNGNTTARRQLKDRDMQKSTGMKTPWSPS
jgi:hypothetical protein